MDALRELRSVRQDPGEPFRRWFRSAELDLIVWQDPRGVVVSFQLCYEEDDESKALTWTRDGGFSHRRVDDGEGRPARHKMTPILVPDGTFSRDRVLALFERSSTELDPHVRDLVAAKLRACTGTSIV
jgi:hypothetical protein